MAKKSSSINPWFARASERIPKVDVLVERALATLLSRRNDQEDYIRQNFSALVQGLQDEAYRLYLEFEKRAGGQVLSEEISALAQKSSDPQNVALALEVNFLKVDKYFLSFSNSRKSRAGTSFELVVTALFERLNYPHMRQPVLGDSNPDYVMPSLEYYEKYSADCILFTCKRTLRERWRQVITEGKTSGTYYLATIDKKLSSPEISRMKDRNVCLVVPASLKEEAYREFVNVVSFENFFRDFLDPAVARWKSNGVI
jgi:EcoRII C terminal